MNNKRTHILLISDPPAAPGYLPRVRFMCDFLVQKGYDVTWMTEAYGEMKFEHACPLVEISMFSGSTFDWICKTAWTLLTDWHNRAFAKRILNLIRHSSETYDLVLCSTFSDFPLGAAQRVAKALNVPLLCDIRDLDEQVERSNYQYHHQAVWTKPFRPIYRAIHVRRRNKVLRTANAITTVSPWHAEFIQAIRRQPSAVSVVYNGFDEKQFYPKDIPTDRFTVTYIGSLFEWQKPALEKVQALLEDRKPEITLEIHTPTKDPIRHDRLGDAIRRSSIMLVLTDTKTHGMLTTKFYEALGCEKPVLCVPSDKGALADLITYTNAGIATDEPDAIKAFIEEKYQEWKAKGFTRQQTEHRSKFSRENQCRQLEEIIKTLIA